MGSCQQGADLRPDLADGDELIDLREGPALVVGQDGVHCLVQGGSSLGLLEPRQADQKRLLGLCRSEPELLIGHGPFGGGVPGLWNRLRQPGHESPGLGKTPRGVVRLCKCAGRPDQVRVEHVADGARERRIGDPGPGLDRLCHAGRDCLACVEQLLWAGLLGGGGALVQRPVHLGSGMGLGLLVLLEGAHCLLELPRESLRPCQVHADQGPAGLGRVLAVAPVSSARSGCRAALASRQCSSSSCCPPPPLPPRRISDIPGIY